MKEVFGAVLATSLVLMAVFVPVSFMTGITGQMFRQFALCIASSIGLSTVVALTLAPALCSMILKSGEEHSDFKFIQDFDNWFNKVRDKYLEGAKVFIDSPKLTIVTFLIIMVSIVGLFKIIPTGFLPTEDFLHTSFPFLFGLCYTGYTMLRGKGECIWNRLICAFWKRRSHFGKG